jgi:hypothetical protein
MTQKGIASFSLFLLLCNTKGATAPASLFVPALHALMRMGIDWWDNQVYRRRAGSAQLYRRRAGSAQLGWYSTPAAADSRNRFPLLGSVAGWSELSDRAHRVCFESAQRGTRVRGSGVCTAVNGIVPLTGRRTHLVLHYIYIVFTTSGRKPHRGGGGSHRQCGMWVKFAASTWH